MLKKLTSPWVGSIIGLISFLAVTAVTWNAATANISAAGEESAADAMPTNSDQSAVVISNVEVDALVHELRDQKEALAKREKDLNELANRLSSERNELNQLTQTVHRLQKEFDLSVNRVADEEAGNLKKLAKTYSAMEPEGSATIFKQMDDSAVVKIMMFMKEQETGPILAAMARTGDTDAKRAADLTEKLRLAVVPKKK
jgi:flagellar motility protein MotE (MotC chaperone)